MLHPFLTELMAAQALPAPETDQSVPEWVHLLPAGEIGTTDARGPYHVTDRAAIIAASFADTDRLPVDENHSTDLAAPNGQPAPARGWITAMEARADGIWGKVEWNAAGTALLADRAYRGISPVIAHDKAKNILAILRASLVNRPNLRGLTALHQQQETPDMDLTKLLAKLGLQAGASEDAILAAIDAKAAPDTALQSALTEIGTALGVEGTTTAILTAAKGVKADTTVVTALQAEVAELTTKLNTVTDGQARTRAETFVDGEVRRGNPVAKRMRDHYIAMHMADAARVEKELSAMPALSGTILDNPPPKDGEIALNAAQKQAAVALGIDPAKYLETLKSEAKKEAV